MSVEIAESELGQSPADAAAVALTGAAANAAAVSDAAAANAAVALTGAAAATDAAAVEATPTATAPPAVARPSLVDVPLRRNRDFQILLSGQSVSAIGDAVSFTAMPLLVLQLTGSGIAMGIVGALGRAPDLLFGLPAGVLADRVDRKRVMLISDAARALLTALVPLSALLGLPTMAVIYLVTFPINTFRVFFMSGWTGATPNLVGRRDLGRAVSAVEGVVSLSFIIGPAIAGILVGIVGAAETLAIDAASFAFSAVTLTLIHRPFQAERKATSTSFWADMREGMSFIARHPVLRLAVGIWTGAGVVFAGLTAALTFAVTIDRNMSAADLGFVLSAYGIGNLVGAVGGGRFTKGRLAPPLLGGYFVQAVAIIAIGLPTSLPLIVLLIGALVGGVGSGFTVVSYLTYRAAATPDRLLSRVGSTARTLSIGLQPVGMFATGVLLDIVGGNVTVLLTGAGMLILAILFSLSSTLRAARGDSHPDHEAVPA